MGSSDIVELARMCDATSHVGLGWVGRAGCNDIVEFARMFDATSHVGLGWAGSRRENFPEDQVRQNPDQ